jgi:hypothetical protein
MLECMMSKYWRCQEDDEGVESIGEKTKVGERGRGVRRGNELSINHAIDGQSLMGWNHT